MNSIVLTEMKMRTILYLILAAVCMPIASTSYGQVPPPLPDHSGPPPLPPPLPKTHYWVAIEGEPKGPFALRDIKRMVQEGRISPDTLMWKEGTENWVEAQTYPEIAKLFQKPPFGKEHPKDIRHFVIGTWTGQYISDEGHTINVMDEYHEDGFFHEIQVVEGSPPVEIEGTWQVKEAQGKRFTLAGEFEVFVPGAEEPISRQYETPYVIIDDNTIRNLKTGWTLHRSE